MNTALVVIDLQNDITKNFKDIICNVNKAIEKAQQNGFIVVYVKHNNITEGTRTFKAGTRGEAFVPELDVVSDNVFVKTKGNALTSEEFVKFIEINGINEFYVCGADATACVKSTCFDMSEMRIQGSRFVRLRDELRQVENRRNVEVLRKQRVRTIVRCGFLQRIDIVMKTQIQNLF